MPEVNTQAHDIELLKVKFDRKFRMLQSRIKNVNDFVEALLGDGIPNIVEVQIRQQQLEQIWNDFHYFQETAVELPDDTFQEMIVRVTNFEEVYVTLSSRLKTIHADLKKNETFHKTSESDQDEKQQGPKPRLPKLPETKIKPFDGNQTEWLTFKQKFISLIHGNKSLDNILKFTYLDDLIIGQAKDVIRHITLSETAYNDAWGELVKRYDDVRIIVNTHIDALLSIECIKNNHSDLLYLLNSSNAHVSSLKALGIPLDKLSELLIINIIVKKFSQNLKMKWEEQIVPNVHPTWEELKAFMDIETRILKAKDSSLHNSNFTSNRRNVVLKQSTTFVASTSGNTGQGSFKSQMDSTNLSQCTLCKEKEHPLYRCDKFISMSPMDRNAFVSKSRKCFNCLGFGHSNKFCKSSKCKVCNKNHNTLLHLNHQANQADGTTYNKDATSKVLGDSNSSDQKKLNLFGRQSNSTTAKLFATALVYIEDGRGKSYQCRALLDSASSENYVTKNLTHMLNLNQTTATHQVCTLNGGTVKINSCINTIVKSRLNNYCENLQLLVVDTIADHLPAKTIDVSRWFIPKDVILADPDFGNSRPVDLLLGLDTFWNVLGFRKIKINNNLPYLIESKFGFIVGGSYSNSTAQNLTFFCDSISDETSVVTLQQLNNSIRRFWEIETLPLPQQAFWSNEERFCDESYTMHVKRNHEGRYIVKLPLRENIKQLCDNRQLALNRFLSMEKRLQQNEQLKEQYCNFMSDYQNLCHMREVKEEFDSATLMKYYLPHHPVLKPTSSTTKLRVVFDASAKTGNGLSLNEVMCVGPTTQSDLFDIVLRFRKYLYVVTADISKMYRQVLVDPSHTALQRIFWRPNPSEELKTFELSTVTYGTASAPFLATRTLQQLADDECTTSELAVILKRDFYVDDILTGSDDKNKLREIVQQLCIVLSKGGFQLHKWSSNNEFVLQDIPLHNRETLNNGFNDTECIKALGLFWQPARDQFFFDVNDETMASNTKRTIFSSVSKLFDPLGFISPITTYAKLIIQDLWRLNKGWDETVDEDTLKRWRNFKNELHLIKTFNIPRHFACAKPQRLELHGYADASQDAYGACLYVRTIDYMNNVHVRLVCAKGRVAPLKVISLPRLELCAAHLLAQLTQRVLHSLDMDFNAVYLWGDSQITLTWIQTDPKLLKTFVANRVSEIKEITANYLWCYIETQNNPADSISRGSLPHELQGNDLWWNGPTFLSEVTHEFKSYEIKRSPNSTINWSKMELRNNSSRFLEPYQTSSGVNFALSTCKANVNLSNWLYKYSTFSKTVRITAYIQRFINACKSKIPFSTELSIEELDSATIKIVQLVQIEHFGDEYKCLKANRSIHSTSKIRLLNPFLDDNNVIRVGGRLSNTNLPQEMKHQFLLPDHNHITRLLFIEYHKKYAHAGVALLISFVRQRYWPINARSIANNTIRTCIECFKLKPAIRYQIMGNLPAERAEPSSPFSITGVDLCGPFYVKQVKRQRTPDKVYVVLFVCFCTKAVHLEIVSDLSADKFILALKRFLYRRGKPVIIWSDNGTNFVGTNKELQIALTEFHLQQNQRGILEYCTSESIKWKFIPPRAPNFGGLWESSIKSFKGHIRRITKDVNFNYEELNTLIIMVEGIMNSRPLVAISNDPSDPLPLTPAHFLIHRPIVANPEPSYCEQPSNRLLNWQKITKLTQDLWKRYSLEYLHTLQQRQKWQTDSDNLRAGDVVLVVDDNLPSTQWLMGVVERVCPGLDGKVRVAEINTRKGVYKRTVSKLAKLPIERNDASA